MTNDESRPAMVLLGSLLWLAALILAAPLQAQDLTPFNPRFYEYQWPTNASEALSGTFAETRSRHFHAALDIKTWGRRGYPVYATRDGVLHRMAIGPTGYGKVLYLKHSDGSYSLYAHLLRFNDRLQQLADSIRFSRNYASSIDMVVDSLGIRIEQGEQIALSGASGIGPPHLHFELRTPGEEPFNPLLTNLSIKDDIAPSFSGLAVVPLTVQSRIEGKNRIYTRRPNRRSSYADFGTVTVSGKVGLAADLFDQANGVSNVYAVYTTTLRVNGEEVFHSRADQFSYEETDQMHLDRVYPLLQSTGRGFQRLYVEDGNTLSFYRTAGNSGRLQLPPGTHEVEIEARDFQGNTRRARLRLRVERDRPQPAQVERIFGGSSGREPDPGSWTWFDNWVNIPDEEFQQLTLAPLLSSPLEPVYYDNGSSISVNLAQSPQFYFRTSPTNYFTSRRVHPRRPAYLATPDDQAYAYFSGEAFYDTVSVAMTKQVFASDSIEVHLFPDSQPMRRDYTLSVKLDSLQRADTTLSFYRTYPGSSYLRRLESELRGAYLTAEASQLGRFLVLSDRQAPRIRRPRIVRSPDDLWLLYIPAWDRRSGIDYERSRLYVNGVRGLTEYEPEDGRLVYYHPDFVPQSRNEVRIVAFDKAGNKVERTYTISR